MGPGFRAFSRVCAGQETTPNAQDSRTVPQGFYRYRSVICFGTNPLNLSVSLCFVSGSYQPGPHHWKTNFEVSLMASVALVRVSGSVLSVPPARTGITKSGPRQGETWTAESVNILVADQNVTAVRLPFRDSTGIFEGLQTRTIEKGDIVDFLCEVSVYQQDVQTRAIGLWPADDVSSYLAAAS